MLAITAMIGSKQFENPLKQYAHFGAKTSHIKDRLQSAIDKKPNILKSAQIK